MKFEKIRDAFNEGVQYCHLYGLDWRQHMKAFFENGTIAGYHVIDETGSTTVKTIRV